MNRKEYLKTQSFGTLQSTPEYKHYCDTYLNVCLMNEEVEYILKKSYDDSEAPFSYDDFRGMYLDDDELRNELLNIMGTLDKKDKEECLKEIEDNFMFDSTKDVYDKFIYECDEGDLNSLIETISYFSHLNAEDYQRHTEIMQWFLVWDDRIIKELEKRGEVILNDKFWGRQCYGQSITMDGVIVDIFKEWYLELYGLPFDLNKEVE